jgi:hypothetical protein
MTHTTHTAAFDATCPTCWSRFRSNNLTWVDPLTVDEPPDFGMQEFTRGVEADPGRTWLGLILLAMAFVAGFALSWIVK